MAAAGAVNAPSLTPKDNEVIAWDAKNGDNSNQSPHPHTPIKAIVRIKPLTVNKPLSHSETESDKKKNRTPPPLRNNAREDLPASRRVLL